MIPRPEPRGFGRHLDGWQAGVLVLVIAGSAILLALPRAVAPDLVPEPRIDRHALAEAEARDDRLAVEAETRTLDVDVRAVGSEFRAYNQAVAASDADAFGRSRYAVVEAARRALAVSVDELAMLRAYHTTIFVRELRRWEATGEVSADLTDLSGDFVDAVRRNAWCEAGAERKLVMDDSVLRVLFKKRWNDIVGVRGEVFDLTLDEDRVRHAFLIRHPFRRRVDVRATTGTPLALDNLIETRRLESVERLAERDPTYPLLLARGIVHFQSGSFARAAAAFRAYLDEQPNGPYTLRTRNYLKAALDKSAETGGI